MMMFVVIILWITIGMAIEYKSEKKRKQEKQEKRNKKAKTVRRIYDYCVYEDEYQSKKSA